MNYSLDVRDSGWDRVDFDHCTLFLAIPRVLPAVLSLEIWGIVIHTVGSKDSSTTAIDLPLEFDTTLSNVFVGGSSTLKFENVSCLDVDMTLYNPKNLRDFLCDGKGEEVRFSRTWGRQSNQICQEYNLGGYLAWPPSDCEISVKTTGGVTLEFSIEDCLSEKDQLRATVRPPWV